MGKRCSMPARDAYDLAGCTGESIADDFIAMEMAGYGPDEHGDFLIDALMPGGDVFGAHRRTRERAAAGVDRKSLKARLRKAKLTVSERNDGLHWLIDRDRTRMAEFWPTTGKWRLKNGTNGRGFNDLIKALTHA